MPFKNPLTAAQLTEIRARYSPLPGRPPACIPEANVWPDIAALLWEVKRLRALVLTAYQLRDTMTRPANCLGTVHDEFLAALAAEPCVVERDTLVHELTGPAARPRRSGPHAQKKILRK